MIVMASVFFVWATLATVAMILTARALIDAEKCIRRWQQHHAIACDRANEFQAQARPHQAERAEWKRAHGENAELHRAKRVLRRRLRAVLCEARRWKGEAVSRGWTRAEMLRDRRAMKMVRRGDAAGALATMNEGER